MLDNSDTDCYHLITPCLFICSSVTISMASDWWPSLTIGVA